MKSKKKLLIGVDEAGRGSLAGPVAVGAVLVAPDFDFSVLGVVRDSKQMSAKARQRTYTEARKLARRQELKYAVALISHTYIDRHGITRAVAKGIEDILEKLDVDGAEVEIRLDGLLRAPKEFKDQKTIVKGDVTEPSISLASIMAKVTRDKYMERISKKYPAYTFEVHKGYGTLRHREAIRKEGLSKIHRRSFTKKCL